MDTARFGASRGLVCWDALSCALGDRRGSGTGGGAAVGDADRCSVFGEHSEGSGDPLFVLIGCPAAFDGQDAMDVGG